MNRLLILLVAICALSAGACGKNIGDACGNNVDCSITGDRFCDTAPPNGYCTVEGCDVDSCPGDSVCVRFYVSLQSKPCYHSPDEVRGQTMGTTGPCNPDERCLCDESKAGACTDPTIAHCAPENSERRWCMKRCGEPSDCRDGYTCRSTGTLGAEPVPSLRNAAGESSNFCVSIGI